MTKRAYKLLRWAGWLPMVYLTANLGCLPDNALRDVFAENIVRTITLYTSSFVSLLFFNFFRF